MQLITIVICATTILYGMYKLGHDIGYDEGNANGWDDGEEWSRRYGPKNR